MKLITGNRISGKTTELIKKSSNSGIYILVETREQALLIAKQAKELKLKIPFPITVDELMKSTPSKFIREKGVLIDESLRVLQFILPVHINTAVVDVTNEERLSPISDHAEGKLIQSLKHKINILEARNEYLDNTVENQKKRIKELYKNSEW